MGGVVYQYHSVLHFPTFSTFNKQLKIGDNPVFSLRDIADVSLPFEKLKVSCNASDERDRRGQSSRRSTGSRRVSKNHEAYKPKKGGRKSKSSGNQEEIISLFRRIQSSISNDVEPTKRIKSDASDASEETPPSSESILRVLQGGSTMRKEVNLERQKVDPEVQQLQANPSVTDAKLTRPPSKFFKRSPIPSSSSGISSPPGKLVETKIGASVTTVELKLASERVKEMKLPELKELAKSRGIRLLKTEKEGADRIADILNGCSSSPF